VVTEKMTCIISIKIKKQTKIVNVLHVRYKSKQQWKGVIVLEEQTKKRDLNTT